MALPQASDFLLINDGTKTYKVTYGELMQDTGVEGGDTPPSTPGLGDLWVDTSECPPVLNVWDDCSDPGNPSWTPIGGGTVPPAPIDPDPITDIEIDGGTSGGGGDGSALTPFILESVTVDENNTAGFTTETIKITNQKPGDLVTFSVNSVATVSDPLKDRFEQDVTEIDSNGEASIQLKYVDTPATVDTTTYQAIISLGNVYFQWEVEKKVTAKPINPEGGDVNVSPTPSSGSGTELDPYVLTPITVSEPGGRAGSRETITISGQVPDDIVKFTSTSTNGGTRFDQPEDVIDNFGEWIGKLVYNDTPETTSAEVYNGKIQIGDVYFTWEVTQLVGSIDTPTVLTPPDGSGVGGPISYNANTSKITSVTVAGGGITSSPDTSRDYSTIAVGNGKFLAFNYDSNTQKRRIIQSTNGKSWGDISALGNIGSDINDIQAVGFNSSLNKFYIAWYGGGRAYYRFSSDGINWDPQQQAESIGGGGNVSAFDGTGPIMISAGGDAFQCVTSNDNGNNWTVGSVGFNGYISGVASGNGWAMILYNSSTNNSIASNDGFTSSSSNVMPAGYNWGFLKFVNGKFWSGWASQIAYASTPTSYWSQYNTPNEFNAPRDIAYGGGTYVAISNNGIAYSKNNGASWTKVPGIDEDFRNIEYQNGVFVTIKYTFPSGGTNTIYYSSDGVDWSSSKTVINLTNNTIYDSNDLSSVISGANLANTFPAGTEIRNNNNNSIKGIVEETKESPATITLTREVTGFNVNNRVEKVEPHTEFGPDADNLEFTSTTPSGEDITTYGNATWEVTNTATNNVMTATKAITPGTTQELLPSERGAITLEPDTTYKIRVKYDAADPSGVESDYSDANHQFMTAGAASKDEWIGSKCTPRTQVWDALYADGNLVVLDTDYYYYSTDPENPTFTENNIGGSGCKIRYVDNKYFILTQGGGTGSALLYSTDLSSFTSTSLLKGNFAAESWSDVAHGLMDDGNTYYIAVAYNSGEGPIAYSTSLSGSWTKVYPAATGSNITGVAYGDIPAYGKVFVACRKGSEPILYAWGTVQNWTPKKFPAAYPSVELTGIAYGDGLFVAVAKENTGGSGINRIFYNTNPISSEWEEADFTQNCLDIVYDNGIFVVRTYTNIYYTTADDITNWKASRLSLPVGVGLNKGFVYSSNTDDSNGHNIWWSESGKGVEAFAFNKNDNAPISETQLISRYGVDPTADNTSLGIAELTELPTGTVAAFVPDGDKYKPIIDLSQPLEQAQADAAEANARLDEANATIETMRSNFETRIAALELANATTYNYDVTVVNTGYGNKYFIDGNQQPTLNVNSGDTLVFDQSDSSNTGHPLRIYEDEARTTEVSSGVTVDGTTITYVPSTAGTYYYQCQAHAGMGGQITVS